MVDKIFEALFERYPALECCKNDIAKAYDMLVECFENGGKMLCCGNGGSAADCDHFVGELMKGFLLKRPLSDSFWRFFNSVRFARSFACDFALCAYGSDDCFFQ